MTARSVTLDLPGPLYTRLKRRAEESQRTVEAEILDMVAAAVPLGDDLPADLEAAVAPLSSLTDDALWALARSHLSLADARDLASLNAKQQRDGLTAPEAEMLAALVRCYERAMLVRARAAALLKQRGRDISSLLDNAA